MSRINEEQWGEFLAEFNARNAAVQPPATPQEPESPYKPCPFCGGQAEKIAVEEASNVGGYVVTCCSCDASSAVVFPVKDSPDGLLDVLWNRRASTPSPEGQTADELRRIAAYIRTPGNIWWEDAIDEIARLLENRARQLSPLPSPPTPEGAK